MSDAGEQSPEHHAYFATVLSLEALQNALKPIVKDVVEGPMADAAAAAAADAFSHCRPLAAGTALVKEGTVRLPSDGRLPTPSGDGNTDKTWHWVRTRDPVGRAPPSPPDYSTWSLVRGDLLEHDGFAKDKAASREWPPWPPDAPKPQAVIARWVKVAAGGFAGGVQTYAAAQFDATHFTSQFVAHAWARVAHSLHKSSLPSEPGDFSTFVGKLLKPINSDALQLPNLACTGAPAPATRAPAAWELAKLLLDALGTREDCLAKTSVDGFAIDGLIKLMRFCTTFRIPSIIPKYDAAVLEAATQARNHTMHPQVFALTQDEKQTRLGVILDVIRMLPRSQAEVQKAELAVAKYMQPDFRFSDAAASQAQEVASRMRREAAEVAERAEQAKHARLELEAKHKLVDYQHAAAAVAAHSPPRKRVLSGEEQRHKIEQLNQQLGMTHIDPMKHHSQSSVLQLLTDSGSDSSLSTGGSSSTALLPASSEAATIAAYHEADSAELMQQRLDDWQMKLQAQQLEKQRLEVKATEARALELHAYADLARSVIACSALLVVAWRATKSIIGLVQAPSRVHAWALMVQAIVNPDDLLAHGVRALRCGETTLVLDDNIVQTSEQTLRDFNWPSAAAYVTARASHENGEIPDGWESVCADAAARVALREVPSDQGFEPEIRRVLFAANHYEALGIGRGAATAQVKAAFKRIALAVHPDKQHVSQEALQAKVEEDVERQIQAKHATKRWPEDYTLSELKKLAEKRGIKTLGQGWKSCCPPSGSRDDIARALSSPTLPMESKELKRVASLKEYDKDTLRWFCEQLGTKVGGTIDALADRLKRKLTVAKLNIFEIDYGGFHGGSMDKPALVVHCASNKLSSKGDKDELKLRLAMAGIQPPSSSSKKLDLLEREETQHSASAPGSSRAAAGSSADAVEEVKMLEMAAAANDAGEMDVPAPSEQAEETRGESMDVDEPVDGQACNEAVTRVKPGSDAALQRVKEARDVLQNEERRREYTLGLDGGDMRKDIEWAGSLVKAARAELSSHRAMQQVAVQRAMQKLPAEAAQLSAPLLKDRQKALVTLGTLDPSAILQCVERVRACLDDDNASVRIAAVRALFKIASCPDPADFDREVPGILAKLEDPSTGVRNAVVSGVSNLLAPHAPTIVAKLAHVSEDVRESALRSLEKLQPSTLSQHAPVLVAQLKDSNEAVRMAAIETVGKLEPSVLSAHVPALVAKLEDGLVNRTAVKVLEKLAPSVLSEHAPAIVAKLDHSNGSVRLEALNALGMLEPAALSQFAPASLAMLEDSDASVRWAAVSTLGTLEKSMLSEHAPAIVARLDHSNGGTRQAALRTLGQLELSVLSGHAPALIAKFEDSDHFVRMEAVVTLALLGRPMLSQHAPTLVAKLEDENPYVREAVVKALDKLQPSTLSPYAPALVANLEHSDYCVRRTAVEVIGKLTPSTLLEHAPAIVAKLEHSNGHVRHMALNVLGKLAPYALSTHAPAIVATFEDSDGEVREVAVAAIGKLQLSAQGRAALAQHAPAVVGKLEDAEERVRHVAMKTLEALEPSTLSEYVPAIVARLEDSCQHVRKSTMKVVGKLEPSVLSQHAPALVAMLEHSNGSVRESVVEVLGKLAPSALSQHAPALVAKLEDSDYRVQEAALDALGKLELSALSQLAPIFVEKLEDSDTFMREAAAELLRKARWKRPRPKRALPDFSRLSGGIGQSAAASKRRKGLGK